MQTEFNTDRITLNLPQWATLHANVPVKEYEQEQKNEKKQKEMGETDRVKTVVPKNHLRLYFFKYTFIFSLAFSTFRIPHTMPESKEKLEWHGQKDLCAGSSWQQIHNEMY